MRTGRWLVVFTLALCVAATFVTGCVNLYERAPWTSPRIETLYQPARTAAAITAVASFPQVMSDRAGLQFQAENIFTILFLGLPCAVDTCLEVVADTALLPADLILSEIRGD